MTTILVEPFFGPLNMAATLAVRRVTQYDEATAARLDLSAVAPLLTTQVVREQILMYLRERVEHVTSRTPHPDTIRAIDYRLLADVPARPLLHLAVCPIGTPEGPIMQTPPNKDGLVVLAFGVGQLAYQPFNFA